MGGPRPTSPDWVEATRLPAATLEELWGPLARYAALMERRFGNRRIARAARPMLWSRFCKACLAENAGRWAVAWRLPWWVACPAHRSLLSSTCPTCGQLQRQGRLLHDLEPDPTTCSMPPAGGSGRGDRRCGADLTEGSISTAVNLLAMDAQQRLAVLVDHAGSAWSIAAAADELADLLTLASLTGLDFETLDPEGLSDTSALSKAWHQAEIVLSETTGNALTALALADVRERPHPLPRRWHTASTALTSRVLSIRDPHLRPVDRLRWRTTVSGRRPDQPDNDPFSRAVPWALWPDWSVRLHPRTAVEFAAFRSMAAAALALPGSSRRVEDVVTGRDEDPAILARKVSHVLQAIAATDHGRVILRALTQLSDGLRTYGSPIDYQRRRHIATTGPPLDLPAWDRICAAAGTPTGGHRKLKHARLWIWETLTGGLPQKAPAALRPENTADPSGYDAFALRLPSIAVTHLEAHARSVLDSHGCADEPLTWSPPPEWADTENLPLPDLDRLNMDRLALLLRGRRSPTAIADDLGTSLDHVRLVLRRNPGLALLSGPRRGTSTSGRTVRTLPPASLTTERLRTLVLDDRRTLRSLAEEFGVSRTYLADRLRRDGIPVPPPYHRPTRPVDPDWLRTEYVDRKRTLPAIAAEVGMTAPNLARIARTHSIPLRRRGGASHAASLTVKPGWPQPLAASVLGQSGTERVRRFQVYARHRSLTQAADALGVYQSVLTSQLAQLEVACGGQLIVRSARTQQSQCPTALGRLLLNQADKHLGPHPDAPAALPESLATALASFWGAKRLRWFRAAARSKSIMGAAAELGADRYTVDRSIRGLEQVVGGILLHRSTPGQPHKLSPLGRRVLTQMNAHLATPAEELLT